MYRQVRNDLGLANVLLSQGDLALRRGELDTARIHYQVAEPLHRKVQHHVGLAYVSAELARLADRADDAARYAAQARRSASASGSAVCQADAERVLAGLDQRHRKAGRTKRRPRAGERRTD